MPAPSFLRGHVSRTTVGLLAISAALAARPALPGQPEAGNGDALRSAAGRLSAGVTCQIRPYHDKPVMFVNDVPRFPMAFISYYPEASRYQQMGQHGVHVYSLSLTLTDKWFNRRKQRVSHSIPGIWKASGAIDFAVVEKRIGEIVAADPQAVIFPRIYCDSPLWWDEAHPDDVRSIRQGCPLRQSYSSSRWREETAEVLKKIVRFVSSSRYGERVIGYMIGVGQTEELGDQSDFTGCAQEQFREWLGNRYGSQGQAIRRLFGKDLEAISIPSEAQQQKGDCGNFLDPKKSRLVIDYRQFHSDETVDVAIGLCKAVKEASGRRLMTGVFYGYTRILPEWGHLALRRLLESDAVDFVSNPYSSGGRKSHLWVGQRDFHTFTENDSVQRAGKLFYYETDIRTSQSRWISQLRPELDPKGEYNSDSWLGPPTIADSLQLLKAVFAKVLLSGSANWWFDLWGGWYDHEQILQLFARMQAIGDESIHRSSKSVAQIAVLLDEKAYCYLAMPQAEGRYAYDRGRFAWVENQLAQLGRIGAPYDFYLLDELKDLDLSRYRMLVFLNAFGLSEDQRRILHDRCMSRNRWLVWLYAPGLIKDDLSLDNMASLLGMKFEMAPAHAKANISLDLPGEPGGTVTYEGAAVSPLIFVSRQGNAPSRKVDTTCGRTAEGHVVVIEKAGSSCRHLFVAIPPLPWKALQYFAKKANVHLYSEAGDVVFANESYLAVAAAASGKHTIRLPKKTALQEILALGKAESLAAHTCRLFRLVPSATP